MQRGAILPLLLFASILYANEINIESVASLETNPIDGDRFCFKGVSSLSIGTTANRRNCLYFWNKGDVLSHDCKRNAYVDASSLNPDQIYQVTVTSASIDQLDYTITFLSSGEITAGRCPDDLMANSLYMDTKDFNFVMYLTGSLMALGFWAFVLMVIKNLGAW